MKLPFKLFLIITLIFSYSQACYSQEISNAHYVNAKEYLKIDSLNLALSELDSATTLAPNFAKAYILKGDIWKLKMEDRKAIWQYSLAILHNPSLIETYLKRAALHFTLKDHRDYILNDINKAIKLQPNSADLYDLKAYYYAHTLSPKNLKPDYKNAIDVLNTAIILEPKKAKYLNIRSDYKFKNNQKLSALLDISKAIELDPKKAQYYHFRGVIRFTMSDFRSSLNDINTAIELNNFNFLYFQFRGNIYYNLKRYNQAYADYSTTLDLIFQKITKTESRLSSNNPLNIALRETLLLRGMTLVQENKPYDGCDDFKRAQQMGESKASNYIRQYCN